MTHKSSELPHITQFFSSFKPRVYKQNIRNHWKLDNKQNIKATTLFPESNLSDKHNAVFNVNINAKCNNAKSNKIEKRIQYSSICK